MLPVSVLLIPLGLVLAHVPALGLGMLLGWAVSRLARSRLDREPVALTRERTRRTAGG